MSGELFLDVELLRGHTSEIQEELRLTRKLCQAVKNEQVLASAANGYAYNRIIQSVNDLESYFSRMKDVLEDAVEGAVQLERNIAKTVDDGTISLSELNKIGI